MNDALARLLTQEENRTLCEALLGLLRIQALSYTQGDSASLPEETLTELLASLLYTLGIRLDQPQSFTRLAGKDLRPLYEAGYHALLARQDHARAMIAAICRETPSLGCISLSDTVRSIALSLEHYDARFFAHHIPGEIDYQLLDPVPQEMQGMDYILLYLARLHAEMRFLSRFPLHRVLALLDGANPEWRELVANLCAPIAANALGLSLLGEAPRRLHIRNHERHTLLALFSPLHPLEIEHRLLRESSRLLDTLDLKDAQTADMLRALCCDLAPRIRCAADAGDLSSVFPSFSPPGRKQFLQM